MVLDNIEEEDEDELQIVKRKDIEMKPMVEEEAILQMNLINHDFFVFKNIDEECVSVIYKRKDGSTFYSTTTATGTKCKQGRTCAADWSVFPKNSWVYVENDPLGGDGLYKVEDRGNFKGNWIDIYVDSAKGHSTCTRYVYQQ